MRLSKQQSAEPTSLVGVPKTCPRTDCPNPTRGVEWRGSPKQLQYHCIGCWRKFDHGGVVRSWAKQVTPPACWLRGLPEHERSKPKLPKRPRRSVSPVSPVPAAPQVHGVARGRAERSLARSVAKSLATSSGRTTAQGLHAAVNSNLASGPAELPLEHNLRAHKVQRKESGGTAGVTHGQDPDAGTTSAENDLVGDGAGEDAGAPASPTWHGLIDLGPLEPVGRFGVGGGASDLLTEPLGEFEVDGPAISMWSFDSPKYENDFWEGEAFGEFPAVPERPGTGIIPVADDSEDVQGITASSANPTSEHLVTPRGKAVKISFLRRPGFLSVHAYAYACVSEWIEELYRWLVLDGVVAKKAS